MKRIKLITGLLFCLMAVAQNGFSQVTITQSNFPRQVGFIDSIYSALNPQTYSLPSEGANQQWDYSNIGASNLIQTEYIDASSDTNFTNAFNKRGISLTFQGFPIEGFEYEALDANGWGPIGIHTNAAAYSITSISGGAGDSLYFPENIDVYTGSTNSLEFPATYQTNWTGTRYETTPFELTVAGFSLQNSPGERVRTVTDSREIVGYGKLMIPDDNGNPSDELDVLLIKSEITIVDSFFLMGNPAPAPLLGAFSLTQGSISNSEAYLFYMPDYGNPVMRIAVNSSGTSPSSVAYRPDAARITTTSVRGPGFANELEIFPNPVNAGQSMMIYFNEVIENAEISLTDITGRTMHRERIDALFGFTRFETPAVVPGIYVLNVNTQNGALIKHSRVVIQ